MRSLELTPAGVFAVERVALDPAAVPRLLGDHLHVPPVVTSVPMTRTVMLQPVSVGPDMRALVYPPQEVVTLLRRLDVTAALSLASDGGLYPLPEASSLDPCRLTFDIRTAWPGLDVTMVAVLGKSHFHLFAAAKGVPHFRRLPLPNQYDDAHFCCDYVAPRWSVLEENARPDVAPVTRVPDFANEWLESFQAASFNGDLSEYASDRIALSFRYRCVGGSFEQQPACAAFDSLHTAPPPPQVGLAIREALVQYAGFRMEDFNASFEYIPGGAA